MGVYLSSRMWLTTRALRRYRKEELGAMA